LLQLQVTEKSNLLPVTSLLVTSYYPTLRTRHTHTHSHTQKVSTIAQTITPWNGVIRLCW